MSEINPDDLMTVGEICEALGYSAARVNTLMRDTGPTLALANGRIKLWTRLQVKEALYEANKTVFEFVGYLSPSESYDVVTEPDA